MELKQETRDVPYKLSEEERRDLAMKHVSTCDAAAELENEAKESATDYRRRVKKLKEEERKQRKAVETGIEERPVLCREIADPDAGTAVWVRSDTGEVLGDPRKLTPEEKRHARNEKFNQQQSALFEAGKKGKEGT